MKTVQLLVTAEIPESATAAVLLGFIHHALLTTQHRLPLDHGARLIPLETLRVHVVAEGR